MNTPKKPSRYPSRSTDDLQEIYQVLDESRFCTLAYVQDGKPMQIPTGFCRIGDKLYVHASSKSHFLDGLIEADLVSFSIMIFDALVLAATAFDHSVNYRSVILHSKAIEIHDVDLKTKVLAVFTDTYIPGRMNDLPAITAEELSVTRVAALDINSAILKRRAGGVGGDNAGSKVWCGIVPSAITYGTPLVDSALDDNILLPDYLKNFKIS
jgi:nitroimidazol reductase NimA-like FMN-containing flavoprotein (pyridoxamine 5'-phosphate oxidase superfamily)